MHEPATLPAAGPGALAHPAAVHQLLEIPEICLNPAARPLAPLSRENYNHQIHLFNSWNRNEPIAPARVLEYFRNSADRFTPRTLHLKRAAIKYSLQLTFPDPASSLVWQKALDLLFQQIRIPSADSRVSPELLVTRKEIVSMVSASENPVIAVMLQAYYYSGARNSELLSIRCRDVAGISNGWALVRIHGKGNKQREVPTWPEDLHNEILHTFTARKPSDYLFKNHHRASRSGGYSRRYVQRAIGALAKKTIGRSIRVHDLRHRQATDSLDQGIPPEVVAWRLGHSDVSTTMRIYAHRASDTAALNGLRLFPAGEADERAD